MQCSCGGATVTKRQPKVQKKVVVSIAELDVCEGCGRNAGPVRIYLVDRNGHKAKRIR